RGAESHPRATIRPLRRFGDDRRDRGRPCRSVRLDAPGPLETNRAESSGGAPDRRLTAHGWHSLSRARLPIAGHDRGGSRDLRRALAGDGRAREGRADLPAEPPGGAGWTAGRGRGLGLAVEACGNILRLDRRETIRNWEYVHHDRSR